MKFNHDRLIVGLLVIAIVVAVAGTWMNLQAVSDNTFITGLSVAGGSSSDSDTLDVDLEGNILNADEADAGGDSTLTDTEDCSHASGGNLATAETITCNANASLGNISMSFGGNYDISAKLNLSNGFTKSTYEGGYCSLSPDTTDWISASWTVFAGPSSDDEEVVMANATAGFWYTLSCEQALAVNWTEPQGVKTTTVTVTLYAQS